MKCVILAGGMQSTLTHGGETIPKPMIEIGERPLLWHIMKHFSQNGINDFIICGGYKVNIIKEYFKDYYIYASDITVDLLSNKITIHNKVTEPWNVTIIDTGIDTSAYDRVKRILGYLDDCFIVTYGDCLYDIDINDMINFHFDQKKCATLTLVQPMGRKQIIQFDGQASESYPVSPSIGHGHEAWISGDCYILNQEFFKKNSIDSLDGKKMYECLYNSGFLSLYRHSGFYASIETLRDLTEAENLWNSGLAPWINDI